MRKVVRVFVSSTFRDMHAERDHLVSVVFPELRERLSRIGLEFFDVDLRWGIPETGVDGERANSWAYCKKWIERTEPFFVCLLGQRYGYVPETTDRGAEPAEPGRSITELEIRHAVLNGTLDRKAFFYFRGPEVPAGALPEIRADYLEPDRADQLLRLKDEIASRHVVRRYPCQWTGHGFSEMDDLGRMVIEDLWSAILRDPEYVPMGAWERVLGRPPNEDPNLADPTRTIHRDLWEPLVGVLRPAERSPLETETETMSDRGRTAARWFQEREQELQALMSFVLGDLPEEAARCRVVWGEPGIGKTAFTAKLAERLAASSAPGSTGPLAPNPPCIITHHVGASARSTSTRWLVERILAEIDRLEKKVPLIRTESDWTALKDELAARLGDYNQGRPVVLLIDGIDRLDTGNQIHWLPRRLGARVRIVVTCTDHGAGSGVAPELLRRHPQPGFLRLGRLSAAGIARIVEAYLEEYCKELEPAHLALVSALGGAGNPTYLMVLLDLLRTLGGNDLNVAVPRLLGELGTRYPTAVEVFDWLLQRIEALGAAEVRYWCSYLLLSRRGFESRELGHLLARRLGQAAAGTAAKIERGLRDHLLRDGDAFRIGSSALAEAVRRRYIADDSSTVEDLHSDIADYLRETANAQTTDAARARALSECGYHFLMARRWADAAAHWLKKDNLEGLLGRLGWARVIEDIGTALASLRRGGDQPPDFLEQVLFSLRSVRAALDGVANAAAYAPDCVWNDLTRDAASNPAHGATLSLLASRHLRARQSAGPRIELDWFNARGARPFVGDVARLLLGPSAGFAISVGDAVAVWRTSDRRMTNFLRSGKKTTAACLLPNSRGLATAAGKTVELWDLTAGEITDSFEVREDVAFLAARGDDLVILTAAFGAMHRGAPPFDELWSWQWKGADPMNAVYDGPRQTVFCPTQKEGILAIRLDARSYVQINPSPGHTLEALALTPQTLVAGDDEGRIRILSLVPPYAELRRGKVTSVVDRLQLLRHGLLGKGEARIHLEGQWPKVEVIGIDPSWIRCVAISPDERLVAVGGKDGFVRVLDAATMNQTAETDVDVGSCMAFVGPRALWASANGKLVQIDLDGPPAGLRIAEISGRSEYLAQITAEGQLFQARERRSLVGLGVDQSTTWEDGKPVEGLATPHAGIIATDMVPVFSTSGRILCAAQAFRFNHPQMLVLGMGASGWMVPEFFYADGTHTSFRYELKNILTGGGWRAASLADRGKGVLALAGYGLALIDMNSGVVRELRDLAVKQKTESKDVAAVVIGIIGCASFSVRGDTLAVARDCIVEIVDLAPAEPARGPRREFSSPVGALAAAPDGSIAGFCEDGTFFRFISPDRWEVHQTPYRSVSKLVYAPDGSTLLAACRAAKRFFLIDRTLREIRVEAYPYPFADVRIAAKGRILIADTFGNVAQYTIRAERPPAKLE